MDTCSVTPYVALRLINLVCRYSLGKRPTVKTQARPDQCSAAFKQPALLHMGPVADVPLHVGRLVCC